VPRNSSIEPSRVRRLWHYAWAFLVRPASAADAMARDRDALVLGVGFVALSLVAFSLVAIVSYVLGRHPPSAPLFQIPPNRWYLVQAFIAIPAGLAGAFTYAGLAYAASRALGGQGTFDATFAASGFTLHLPMLLFIWLPEILVAPVLLGRGTAALPWPPWIDLMRVFAIPLPWAGAISALALARIHRIALWKSVAAMLAGALPTAFVMATFIR
jgi:hypothetical protein